MRFPAGFANAEQREIAKKSPYSITKLKEPNLFECHYKIEDFLRPADQRFN